MILHLNSNNDCENSVRNFVNTSLVMLTNFFYNNLTYLYKVIINVFMLNVIMTAINIISPQVTLILQLKQIPSSTNSSPVKTVDSAKLHSE